MNTFSRTAMCACFAVAASSAFAQDAMKKNEPMKDGMAKPMTMQECKDHMGMAKKDGMKKDDAMMKMDKTCADMMKKDGAMKKDSPADPMKK